MKKMSIEEKPEILMKDITYSSRVCYDILQATYWQESLCIAFKKGLNYRDEKLNNLTEYKYVEFIQERFSSFMGYLARCTVGSGICSIDQRPHVEVMMGTILLVTNIVIRKDYDHEIDFKSSMRLLMVNNDKKYDHEVNIEKELAYLKYITDGNFKNGRKINHIYRFFLQNNLTFPSISFLLFQSTFEDIDANMKKINVKKIYDELMQSSK